jgi:DNA adenine methylase
VAKPFLKWVGGKTSLVPELLKHIPAEYGVYHEPFLGGGALFFAVQPKRAILNDSNEELINCYKQVRDAPQSVLATLEDVGYSKDLYLHMRSLDPATLSDAVRAARFIYLNKTCFNGLYRVNKRGGFNVPMGKYKNPRYFDPQTVMDAHRALRSEWGTLIYSISFEAALEGTREGDFVYLDPPYDPVSKTANFTSYTKDSFKWEDQQRLAYWCHKLRDRGVNFLLSNAPTERILDLYKDFEQRQVAARRNVNSDGQKRGKVSELLVWSTRG